MIDILLSNLFMYGVLAPTLILLLALIVFLPAPTCNTEPQQQWRVVEPSELSDEVKRITAKEVEAEQVYIDSNHRPARLRRR